MRLRVLIKQRSLWFAFVAYGLVLIRPLISTAYYSLLAIGVYIFSILSLFAIIVDYINHKEHKNDLIFVFCLLFLGIPFYLIWKTIA